MSDQTLHFGARGPYYARPIGNGDQIYLCGRCQTVAASCPPERRIVGAITCPNCGHVNEYSSHDTGSQGDR